MDHFAQSSRFILRSGNTTVFPYRPIPLQAIAGTGFNGTYFPPLLYRATEFPGPLDLSLRGPAPITPPTTPSPPRKKSKPGDEELVLSKYFPTFLYQNLENKKIEETENNNNINNFQSTSEFPISTLYPPEDEEKEINCETSSNSDISVTNDDPEQDHFVDITGQDDDSVESIHITDISSNKKQEIDLTSNHENSEEQDDQKENLDISENCGILEKGKRFFENLAYHSRAIEGFAKLFDRNFEKQEKVVEEREESGKTVTKSHKYEKKKLKTRKHLTDDDNSSPVSGTIIRKLRDDEELIVRKGDIDPAFNIVEITEEAKETLSKIDNRIGAYLCQLCRTLYEDAFQLAQHRCSRIVHIEYKCSECEKVFNCPANLASHRRWHKPRNQNANQMKKIPTVVIPTENKKDGSDEEIIIDDNQKETTNNIEEEKYPCQECGKTFRKSAYLKKHLTSHQTKILSINGSSSDKSITSIYESPVYESQQNSVPYENRYTGSNLEIDKKRFHALSEFYFQQRERISAFQYNRDHQFERYYKRTFDEMTPQFNYTVQPVK